MNISTGTRVSQILVRKPRRSSPKNGGTTVSNWLGNKWPRCEKNIAKFEEQANIHAVTISVSVTQGGAIAPAPQHPVSSADLAASSIL